MLHITCFSTNKMNQILINIVFNKDIGFKGSFFIKNSIVICNNPILIIIKNSSIQNFQIFFILLYYWRWKNWRNNFCKCLKIFFFGRIDLNEEI